MRKKKKEATSKQFKQAINSAYGKPAGLPYSSEYIILVDRSMKIWQDWMQGKLTREQYRVLQETTLKEIREVRKNEQKASQEEKEKSAK